MMLMSHPTGNSNVRNAALALAEAGMLGEFWTCVSWNPDSWRSRLLPAGLRTQFARRALPDPVQPYARYFPWREMGRLMAVKFSGKRLIRHERGPFSVDAVYRTLDKRVSARLSKLSALQGVYAYEDGAAATFRAAREKGLACVYDLPIGYWRVHREVLREEAEREPEWAGTLAGNLDSEEKMARKDEEIHLADQVIVASSYTKKTLALAPDMRAPIHVIPYGAPLLPMLGPDAKAPARKLRVLFVGSLDQRKGLAYLLKAVGLLGGEIELTLVGRKPQAHCAPLEAALKVHRWIPSLPHRELLQEYGRHDVFVFPSLFEGFGLVILEALSQGLPVITTPHTGGPDILEEGRDGFIVPIRSPEAIAEKLLLLARDRDLLQAMSQAARQKAAMLPWENYRQRLVSVIGNALGGRHDNGRG
ncbi:glycosyltransferase family 4 protein [Thermithiobacillus tepidarius DSM 3134]|uniref:glycosyltransferase family 4 protein n=1 Tax=Thermithiobacillus tepidarius TaxID=929 RepID=UPI0003F7FB13|nr:glycosyltransferase family 4 protein [Thermithiobacillus tepidarius]